MKCPECITAGQRSKVYLNGVRYKVSSNQYFDEDGIWHNHDVCEQCYRCDNKHFFIIFSTDSCNCQEQPPIDKKLKVFDEVKREYVPFKISQEILKQMYLMPKEDIVP